MRGKDGTGERWEIWGIPVPVPGDAGEGDSKAMMRVGVRRRGTAWMVSQVAERRV